MSVYIKQFKKIEMADIAAVGGKNASLGEIFTKLSPLGISVPDGFAITTFAFEEFLTQNTLHSKLFDMVQQLDRKDYGNLKKIGKKTRQLLLDAVLPINLETAIIKAYNELCGGNYFEVAVRSSATAEGLPEVSFEGQHESYLNIKGEDELLNAVKKCFASLYTDRAIKYREENGFAHMKVALPVGVQKMVQSGKASSGVAFTLDPESGFRDIVHISGVWGLGEKLVHGTATPDEFFVFKPSLLKGKNAIVQKRPGEKTTTMIYGTGENKDVVNIATPKEKQEQFVLSDEEITRIANWAMITENHYQKPMVIEWVKDGLSQELFIIQARPEMVHAKKNRLVVKE